MLGELSLAAGMLGKIWDMAQSGKKDDAEATDGSGGFAAMLQQVGGQAGVQISSMPVASKDEDSSITISNNGETDAAATDAYNYLKDMTSGGLEGAMRTAMKKLRDKVMDSMGVTEDSLAAMDPAQRDAMEAKISEEVQKRIKEAMGADGTGTADEQAVGAKLLEMAKAYKSDVAIV